MDWLARVDNRFRALITLLGYGVGLSIGLFALAIASDLALRRLGVGNIPWLNEVVEYTLYVGVFLAAPWVLAEGAHVRVDLLVSSLSRRWALRLERLLDLSGVVISATLCYYGVLATVEAIEFGSKQYKTLTVSTWWLMAVFAVALGLVTLEFLLRFARADAVLDEDAAAEKAGF